MSDFSGFGEPLVEPGRLTEAQRFDILQRAIGRLRADTVDEYCRLWLATALERALAGESLDAVLGMRGVQRAALRAQRDTLRTKFTSACGSSGLAARVLEGAEPCPPAAAALLEQLRLSGSGTSRTSLWRSRVSKSGR
ncbi:MAG: hypothetical protein H0V16_10135 [Burkholderiaceae bacterium]|nr:hypothetical protein [Burkholderiaceae bacterium]